MAFSKSVTVTSPTSSFSSFTTNKVFVCWLRIATRAFSKVSDSRTTTAGLRYLYFHYFIIYLSPEKQISEAYAILMAKTVTTKEFKDSYKRLNKEQKAAVDTIEGPVIVVAGPGTGKTQILAIANVLVQTDAKPENILAVTFTDSGAKAMQEQLRSLIGDAL